jgi:hypothetical protein
MTSIRKPVTRRTVEPYDHQGRRVVVTLEPGDVLALRWERTRRTFRAPINRVMRAVIQWNVDADRAARRAAKKGGAA